MEKKTVVQIENLTKYFTGVTALDEVCLEIKEREIHAIIGENGAGKSTLCKVLTGIYQPDKGCILLFDKKVNFKDPSKAILAGIGMVYQERNLVGFLTGAENISLGHEPYKGILVDHKQIVEKAKEIKDKLGFNVPLDIPIEKLGAGAQQQIEIMRSFSMNPKVLILDEPTASLSLSEVEPFLKDIKRLRDQFGVSVIFISHKIEEVFSVADRITVFTEGKNVFSARTVDTNQEECVTAMIKKDSIEPIHVPQKDTKALNKILEVKTLTFDGVSHELNFNARLGEVVGFYGLVGSGRTETMEAVFGIRETEERHFVFAGQQIENEDSLTMIQKGMVMTPEQKINGVFLGLSLIDNVCNLFLNKLSTRAGFVKFDKSKNFTDFVLKKNAVKYSSHGQDISGLSGGNKQKIIIGRSIEIENLKLLILDEPTAGLDLGAKHEIYLKIRKLADQENKSVVFISSELEELIATCDRIYVFFNGNVSKEFKRKDFNKINIISAALIRGGSYAIEQ